MSHPVILDDAARVAGLFDLPPPVPSAEEAAIVLKSLDDEAATLRVWATSFPADALGYNRRAAAFEAAAALVRRVAG